MKKLVAILIVLLAIESYGVYGRAQADRIMYTCEVEIGPLCYSWAPNAIGKLLGEDNAEEMEEQLESMKRAWDEEFVERLEDATREKSELERALEKARDGAAKRLDRAAEKVKKVLEALEE